MAERTQAGTDPPRATAGREWEVFVRATDADPLRHVGSVTAPTDDIARERATELLGWQATDVWLCPADETRRFATEDA